MTEINPHDDLAMAQAITSMAAQLASYYRQLTENGLPSDGAVLLVLDFQRHLMDAPANARVSEEPKE